MKNTKLIVLYGLYCSAIEEYEKLTKGKYSLYKGEDKFNLLNKETFLEAAEPNIEYLKKNLEIFNNICKAVNEKQLKIRASDVIFREKTDIPWFNDGDHFTILGALKGYNPELVNDLRSTIRIATKNGEWECLCNSALIPDYKRSIIKIESNHPAILQFLETAPLGSHSRFIRTNKEFRYALYFAEHTKEVCNNDLFIYAGFYYSDSIENIFLVVNKKDKQSIYEGLKQFSKDLTEHIIPSEYSNIKCNIEKNLKEGIATIKEKAKEKQKLLERQKEQNLCEKIKSLEF